MTYLKFHRFRLGKTQTDIARAAGMSQGHYCEIEKGYKKPSAEQYPKLAFAIERPVDELVAKLHGVDAADMVSSRGAK